ncbi:PLP-dependent transferase [Sphingomonas sp. MMS24-JH45]
MRTMALRLKRHEAAALEIAQWLQEREEVAAVLHPALPDHPDHALWARDFRGSAGLFAFVLNGKGETARAALIDTLHHFGIGYSWGGCRPRAAGRPAPLPYRDDARLRGTAGAAPDRAGGPGRPDRRSGARSGGLAGEPVGVTSSPQRRLRRGCQIEGRRRTPERPPVC